MARYRFIQTGNKVICISTYAKKVVKGIAKCSPNDEFDLDNPKSHISFIVTGDIENISEAQVDLVD